MIDLIFLMLQDGITPLIFASSSGKNNFVSILLDGGADVHAKSGSFYTGKKLINRTRNCVSLRFYPGIHIKDPNLVLSGAVFFLKIDMLW